MVVRKRARFLFISMANWIPSGRGQSTWKTRLLSVWWVGTENYVGSLDEVFTSKKGVVLTEKDIQRLAKGSWDKVLSVSPVARPV